MKTQMVSSGKLLQEEFMMRQITIGSLKITTIVFYNARSQESNAKESQNHRILQWLRLEGTSGPSAKQGHLEQVSQDCVQVGFEYLQRLHGLSGQPVQFSVTLTVKKCFLIFS